jgi:coenzyme PQQ precursor peptide PqqA
LEPSNPAPSLISATLGQPQQQFRNPTCDSELSAGISIFTLVEDRTMQWITPAFEEIDLGCEINTYANAEL